jgi:hypothetical protein
MSNHWAPGQQAARGGGIRLGKASTGTVEAPLQGTHIPKLVVLDFPSVSARTKQGAEVGAGEGTARVLGGGGGARHMFAQGPGAHIASHLAANVVKNLVKAGAKEGGCAGAVRGR